MEGIIIKCPKGYIKKINCRCDLVPTKEHATLFFIEEHVDNLITHIPFLFNVKLNSVEKLKVKRVTTIIN